MNLRDQLQQEHSKKNTIAIVEWIGKSAARFEQLISLILQSDDKQLTQRAAWALSYVAEKQPSLAEKHMAALLKNLGRKDLPDAVKRNTLRLLISLPVPKKMQGQIMNLCFNYITVPAEKPAIKAFSLQILENMLTDYPEIGGELKTIIETQWENESPAFRSRARKILRKINT